jgi:predicted transcriptional regulator
VSLLKGLTVQAKRVYGHVLRWTDENFNRPFTAEGIARMAKLSTRTVSHSLQGLRRRGLVNEYKRGRAPIEYECAKTPLAKEARGLWVCHEIMIL